MWALTCAAVGAVIVAGMLRAALKPWYGYLSERNQKRLSVARRGLVRLHGFLRLECTLKILLSFYMIATEVISVYEVEIPADIQRLVNDARISNAFTHVMGLEPFACVGLNSYMAVLLFWMLAPMVIIALILLAVILNIVVHARIRAVAPDTTMKSPARLMALAKAASPSTAKAFSSAPDHPLRSQVLLLTLPYSLRFLFLVYPIVTQKAFQVFALLPIWLRAYG